MITRHFDLPILDWISQHLWCPFLDAIMPPITHLGDAGAVWILLALILLCMPKWRKTGIAMAVALLMGLLLCNLWLKPVIGRIRPFSYQLMYNRVIPLLIQAPKDFSFPSGHTIASFEAAMVLLLRNRRFGIAALAVAILIAFSRLYLYVHYPTDVLASIVLGTGIGLLAVFVTNRSCAYLEQKKNNKI